MRIDQFLVKELSKVSRSRVQQLIERGKVEVNGKVLERRGLKLSGNEQITLLGQPEAPPLKAKAEKIPLTIICEDESLAVIDKPAGMMVHAGAGAVEEEGSPDPRSSGTLVNALLYHFKKLSKSGGDLRPGIVHRLDKETSGLIVVAKTDAAHLALARQFAERKVRKTYIALVHGSVKADTGTVNAPVGRDTSRRHRMSTRVRDGRSALTHYTVVERLDTAYGKFSFLEVTIETGRTHQIRVHLASIGHPVVGDTLYGAAEQIQPTALQPLRAVKTNTKKMRDRAASDIARALTEGEHVIAGARVSATKFEPISLDRNFLHATALEFMHPKSNKAVSLRSGLPTKLRKFLDRLRASKR